ncbi:MAG: hypothetical protein KA742_02770 [Pseudoxanthomonas sp.]|nr:hypothetical protein [Pseudoxanthomonas sp.]
MAARSQAFGIKVDTSNLTTLLGGMGQLDGPALAGLRDSTVNTVSALVRRQAVQETFNYLNLTREYIDSQMARAQAEKGSGRATLSAMIRGTTMQRFGLAQRIRPVNWSNDRIQAMGNDFGAWPGWTRRRGDQYGPRNIPENMKQNGVAVQVYRGRPAVVFNHGYIGGLNKGNGYGLFLRSKGGNLRHEYGPSVYQTFRHFIRERKATIADDLEVEFGVRLNQLLKGFLQ